MVIKVLTSDNIFNKLVRLAINDGLSFLTNEFAFSSNK